MSDDHSTKPLQVFISYSNKDLALATQVVVFLEGKGIGCWIATDIQTGAADVTGQPRVRLNNIQSGITYAKAIDDGIKACPIFVLVLSEYSNASVDVRREIKLATEAGCKVIQLCLHDIQLTEPPENFVISQRVDAYTGPFETHLNELYQGVFRRLKPQVFVSFEIGDQEIANQVIAYLEKKDIDCWIAKDVPLGPMQVPVRCLVRPGSVQASDGIPQPITEGIKACPIMVVLISNLSNASHNVSREVKQASDARARIILFRLQNIKLSGDLNYLLSLTQWVNGFPEPLEPRLERLSQEIFRRSSSGKSDASPDSPSTVSKKWVAAALVAVVLLGCIAYFAFRPQDGSVKIDSDPPGATVWYNGTQLPDTTPMALNHVPVGAQHYKITKNGFQPGMLDVTIVAGKSITPPAVKLADVSTLPTGYGALIVDSDPPGVEIHTLDDQVVGHGGVLQSLPPGKYKYKIVADGYYPQPVDVAIAAGNTSELSVRLNLEYKSIEDTLEISSKPATAKVFDAQGESLGETPWSGPVPVTMQGKTQRYEVFADGYVPAYLQTALQPGQTLKLDTINLQKIGPAEIGRGWTNTLGMKFIYSSVDRLLVSAYETRFRDFEAFINDSKYNAGNDWREPGFPQVPNDPVIRVSWIDARKFCEWLTSKERKAGLLAANQYYRLPTDAEWSALVYLDNEGNGTPESKNGKNKNQYPYVGGGKWPLRPGAGNYGGEDGDGIPVELGYYDGFPHSAPVGSFDSLAGGLFDMGGNASEWCMDWYNEMHKEKVIRGANFMNDNQILAEGNWLLSSHRQHGDAAAQFGGTGFRCVLVLDPDSPDLSTWELEAPPTPTTNAK